MQPDFSAPIRGPKRRDLLRIPAWPWEVRSLRRAMRTVTADVEGTPPVIVLPGLWADDGTMSVLRRYLRRAGYDAQGWGLGRNLAGRGWRGTLDDLSEHWAVGERDRSHMGEGNVPYLCDAFGEVLRERVTRSGRPVALVGWSLGGMIAREAARDHPDCVTGVITLGSPLTGGPKHTFVDRRYRRRGLDVDWIEAQTLARHDRPLACPVVSIYSRIDAIVGWTASLDRWTPGARHYEVTCTHTALPFHPPTLAIIKRELDRIFDALGNPNITEA